MILARDLTFELPYMKRSFSCNASKTEEGSLCLYDPARVEVGVVNGLLLVVKYVQICIFLNLELPAH